MRPQVATPVAAARSRRFPAWTAVAGVLVLAVLAGAAIVLQIRGWSVLDSEPAGACGSGACPRGVVPALTASFAVGLAAIPFVIGAVVRRPRIAAGVVAIGLAAGVFGAQALSGWLHGTGSTPALDAISLPAGSLRTIGFIPRDDIDLSGTSVYPAGARYLVVNLTGRRTVPPATALSG